MRSATLHENRDSDQRGDFASMLLAQFRPKQLDDPSIDPNDISNKSLQHATI